mgnify:FL=1
MNWLFKSPSHTKAVPHRVISIIIPCRLQVGAMEVEAPTRNGTSQGNENGETGTGAYVPSDMSSTYQPLGERQFIDMFTTDKSRSNGHAVSLSITQTACQSVLKTWPACDI